MRTRSVFIPTLFLILSAIPATAQVAINDLFNRPNSNNLGPDWIEQDGNAVISSNRFQAASPSTFGWATHGTFQAPYASTVIRASWGMNGTGGNRVSFIAGLDMMSWSAIEVRIADNDGDGLADRIFFNAAVNAGAWYTSPSFVNMTTPLASGEATMWFSNAGNTVNLDLKDPVSQAVQHYSASGILAAPPTGSQIGIGYFGNGWVDDFRAWTGDHTAPCYSFTTPRHSAPTTLLVTDASPNAAIVIAYSGTGDGPIPTSLGMVYLSTPIEVFLTTTADASGRLEIPIAPLDGSSAGVTLFTQALDATASVLTNHFAVIVR